MLKSAPPILIRLALHHWRIRIFDLNPSVRPARAIRRAGPPRSHWAGTVADDGSSKIQRYYGDHTADNGGCALYGFIRNVKVEKFFASLGGANPISIREHGAFL